MIRPILRITRNTKPSGRPSPRRAGYHQNNAVAR